MENNNTMTPELFWNWFKENEQKFFNIVKSRDNENIVKDFFEELEPRVKAVNERFFFLTGMCEENVAELVITAEGVIREFVFVEEFIAQAPQLPNWKFTALKPAVPKGIEMKMYDYHFGNDTLAFYATQDKDYPDDIDITIVYKGGNPDDKDKIINAIYIYLDNYLGELYFATIIDNLEIILEQENDQELIPIEKLKSYLIWREKEFVEKYENTHYTEEDSFMALQGTTSEGNPIFVSMNETLLNWDGKASHPWILEIMIRYENNEESGLPDPETNELMYHIEDEISENPEISKECLYIGRVTANGERTISFACSDFRKGSKKTREIIEKYSSELDISYDLYKDKYWHSFDMYRR